MILGGIPFPVILCPRKCKKKTKDMIYSIEASDYLKKERFTKFNI